MSTIHFEAPLLQAPANDAWWQQTWFYVLAALGGLGLSFVVLGLLGPVAAAVVLVGLFWGIRRLEAKPPQVGQLRLGPTRLEVVGPAGPQAWDLGPHSRLELKYGGYRGLHRGRVEIDGTTNYLRLDDQEPLQFLLSDHRALEQLRWMLQAWYEQGVPVREYHFTDRTFLLNPHMSYEEIQAFKKKYGVELYG
jgi:hypothetical protein